MSLILSKNNHLNLCYDDNQKTVLRLGKIHRQVGNFYQECLIAAKEMQQSINLPIALFLSGGIDSEIVSEVFRKAGIPSRRIILRFNNDLNLHDIRWAIKYCEDKKLDYEFYDLDITDFFKSGKYLAYARESRCGFPFILPHLLLLEKFGKDHLCIFGNGDLHFEKVEKWQYWALDFWWAYRRYSQNKRLHAVMFFEWSPELLLSWINDPVFQKMFQTNPSSENFNYQIKKYEFYSQYFALEPRPKYRGYEQIPDYHKEYFLTLLKQFNFKNDRICIPVDLYLKSLV